MTRTKLATSLFAVTSLLALAACGGDDEGADPDARDIDAAVDPDADTSPPAPPALGAQMDRMGRPAVNTALNHTFDGNATSKQAAKNAWNEDDAPAGWAAAFHEEVEFNLGILDSLDTVCGNQLLAGATLNNERYNGLANVLADDRLWVKSGSASCTEYLAVEADATGVLTNNECGGRTPTMDVIDRTYSVLAAGVLAGVVDNVAADTVTHSLTAFPFLADPI